jgi:hypothetical protein
MQAGDGDCSAHRFKGTRFVRPLQIAAAFAAALFGTFGQDHRFGNCLRHQCAGGFIAAANSRRFDGIERKCGQGATLVRKKKFESGFVLRE